MVKIKLEKWRTGTSMFRRGTQSPVPVTLLTVIDQGLSVAFSRNISPGPRYPKIVRKQVLVLMTAMHRRLENVHCVFAPLLFECKHRMTDEELIDVDLHPIRSNTQTRGWEIIRVRTRRL
jgi:hypothetical protein